MAEFAFHAFEPAGQRCFQRIRLCRRLAVVKLGCRAFDIVRAADRIILVDEPGQRVSLVTDEAVGF